jgi:hypothetical protein
VVFRAAGIGTHICGHRQRPAATVVTKGPCPSFSAHSERCFVSAASLVRVNCDEMSSEVVVTTDDRSAQSRAEDARARMAISVERLLRCHRARSVGVTVPLAVPFNRLWCGCPRGCAGGPQGAGMSSTIVVRSGGVSIELDREVGVAVLTCVRHRVQDAIPLGRETLGVLMVDFFNRHEACSSLDGHPRVIGLD